KFIFLEPNSSTPLLDENSKRYFEYTVKLQGLDANGDRIFVTPQLSSEPIIVFSRDKLFFSSKEFSASETLTVGSNRIEYHIYHDGCVKINDNLDFSLLHQTGNNELIERIYYRFFDENGIDHDL